MAPPAAFPREKDGHASDPTSHLKLAYPIIFPPIMNASTSHLRFALAVLPLLQPYYFPSHYEC